MSVRTSSCAPRLIPRGPEIYSRILTLMERDLKVNEILTRSNFVTLFVDNQIC